MMNRRKRSIATIGTVAVLGLIGGGCGADDADDGGSGGSGPYRDDQGRLQNQDNPALDGLNPEEDCPNPGLEACRIYEQQQ